MKINQILDKRHLSQTEAVALLRISQPKVSMIQHGKLRGFLLEKLCNCSPYWDGGVGHIRGVNA